MKKIFALILSVLTFCACLTFQSAATENAFKSITNYATPTVPSKTKLRYSLKIGSGYTNAPTAPLVVGNTLIVLSGNKLMKINGKTGKTIADAETVSKSSYTIISPVYSEGVIYVPMDGGTVQAFDYKTMKSLWVFRDSLGGQAVSPVTAYGNYIYVGFWNSETRDANFVCISKKDEDTKKQTETKKSKWAYTSKGGFYFAGACVTGNYVLVGTDDGEFGSEGTSSVVALSKKNGKKISSLKTAGDIRSSVVFDKSSGKYYCVSKAGLAYRFNFNDENGKLSSLKKLKLAGSSTSTPVIYKGRMYIGVQDETAGKIEVIDTNKMKEIYSVKTAGCPQNAGLLTTAYEKSAGVIYVYFTCNTPNGEIVVLKDSSGAKSGTVKKLYTPAKENRQYCISQISAGSDGSLYYKNDSGNIFALTKK